MSPAAYRQLRNLPSDDCPACSSCSCRAILVQSASEVAWESDSPIVRSLVEGHGGTVQASSDGPGKGSTFSVRLPSVPPPSNGGMEANARPAADVSSPALKGLLHEGRCPLARLAETPHARGFSMASRRLAGQLTGILSAPSGQCSCLSGCFGRSSEAARAPRGPVSGGAGGLVLFPSPAPHSHPVAVDPLV